MANIILSQSQMYDLNRKASRRITELCERFNIRIPQLRFDLKGARAGVADHRSYTLRLNPLMFAENEVEFLKQVIPHELCHFWHRQLGFKDGPHGRNWKILMRRMGCVPDRCHNMDVDHLKQRRQTYTAKCACREYQLGAVRHGRMKRGERTYFCKKCKTKLIVD